MSEVAYSTFTSFRKLPAEYVSPRSSTPLFLLCYMLPQFQASVTFIHRIRANGMDRLRLKIWELNMPGPRTIAVQPVPRDGRLLENETAALKPENYRRKLIAEFPVNLHICMYISCANSDGHHTDPEV